MSEKKETITIKKDSLWKIGFFVLAIALVVVLIAGSGNKVVQVPSGNNVAEAPPTSNVKVSITDADPVLGEKDAEISIVEFSDFQCSFCGRAHTGALADFKQSDYFKNGEVNLIYKHLPLTSIHPQAQNAAEASECANRQGKFWEYHDLLFENQGALDDNSLKSYAQTLGLDTAEFNSCLDNDEAKSKVNKDMSEATTAGARGTPYFVVINNKDKTTQVVSGAVPFANFEAAINAVK